MLNLRLLQKSGVQRVQMASSMFDPARRLILASSRREALPSSHAKSPRFAPSFRGSSEKGGPSDLQTFRPSDLQTFRLSDFQTSDFFSPPQPTFLKSLTLQQNLPS